MYTPSLVRGVMILRIALSCSILQERKPHCILGAPCIPYVGILYLLSGPLVWSFLSGSPVEGKPTGLSLRGIAMDRWLHNLAKVVQMHAQRMAQAATASAAAAVAGQRGSVPGVSALVSNWTKPSDSMPTT